MQLIHNGLPPLVADVVLNGFTVAAIADRCDVVTIGPEFSTPELCFDIRKLETGCGGESFDPSDDLSATVFWQELAEDMHVILIEANLMDIDCKTFFKAFEHFEDRRDDLGFKNGFAVLDGDLNVVIALGDIVIPAPDVMRDVGHQAPLYLFVVCCSGIWCLRLGCGLERRVSRNNNV